MPIADSTTLIRLCVVFAISFALNFVWEHLHSVLYVHYKGGPITDFILFRATLGDALFLTALSIPFFRIPFLNARLWLVIPLAVLGAIALELFATSTGRWAYTDMMPLIPLIGTGLTPTIQLGLLGYITFLIAKKIT
jgi:hypothetical protein